MVCAVLSCSTFLSSMLQRSYVNFVRVGLMNNAFQNIKQAIYLKYWQKSMSWTLDTLFGAQWRYILVSQSWTSAQIAQQSLSLWVFNQKALLYIHTCTETHLRTRMHARTHTRTHTCTHKHTHTPFPLISCLTSWECPTLGRRSIFKLYGKPPTDLTLLFQHSCGQIFK